MNTFNECKLKYKYRYHDYYEEDQDAKTDHLNFGKYIHRVFELGYKLETLEELQDLAKSLLKDYQITASYQKKINKCLENFYSFNKNLTESLGVEIAFQAEIGDDMSIRGVIDRVISGTKGGILVLDYKTSKREKTKIDLFKDSQLKSYTYVCSKLYKVPINNITAGHYYPLTNNLVTIQYQLPSINSHIKEVKETIWRIRKCKLTDCTPRLNQYCNWCAYKNICPLFNKEGNLQKNLNERKKVEKKKFEDVQEVIIIK